MQNSAFQFKFADLKLDVVQIEQLMGYKVGESHEAISELTDKLLKEAGTICNIKAEFRIFPLVSFVDPEKSIEINGFIFNVKKIVYGQLKRAESIAVFLCTAGPEIGIRSRTAMNDGDLLTGYIYDVIGSAIAEGAADLMQGNLQEAVSAESKKITNRYSPGYCGWDVAEQHKLFQLMRDNYCGIKLNDSALMNPEKSVSGFIGIGGHVRYNPYTCGLCDMKDCIYRNIKV
ncbi:MAG TPA: methionine synthase [Bacteroidales bacterium]|nr:methionine synthase [Bacteroidales bacterium]